MVSSLRRERTLQLGRSKQGELGLSPRCAVVRPLQRTGGRVLAEPAGRGTSAGLPRSACGGWRWRRAGRGRTGGGARSRAEVPHPPPSPGGTPPATPLQLGHLPLPLPVHLWHRTRGEEGGAETAAPSASRDGEGEGCGPGEWRERGARDGEGGENRVGGLHGRRWARGMGMGEGEWGLAEGQGPGLLSGCIPREGRGSNS